MNKTRACNLLELSLWIINPFLIFLVIFDQKIEAGVFLQWLGKMHPLALHFPIVFGILTGIYFLFFSKQRFQPELEKLLLAINALLASLVALLGIFLAKQGTYQGEIFNLHKWGGLAIAVFGWLFLFLMNSGNLTKKFLAIVYLGILIGATHKGAQLTHGINALKFPEKTNKVNKVTFAADSLSTVFEVAVSPILNQKCASCHGSDKIKGDLRLDSPEYILKGGDRGNILQAGLSGTPVLLEMIHLPIEDEDHMPPDGKLQLTSNELAIIRNWVNKGSDFDLQFGELAPEDSLSFLIKNYIAANQSPEIKTDLPDLTEFNTDYCTVQYLYYGSDDVDVNFFQGSFYSRETLEKLLEIKDNIVYLNMQNMPLTIEDMDIILQFRNLKKVNLNSTGLDITEIEKLISLPELQSLAICGIEFSEEELDNLLSDASLSAINVWSENISRSQLENLVAKYPAIKFTIGDNLEEKIMQINAPLIEQDSLIIRTSLEIKLKHLLNGVDIFYTLDGTDPDSMSQNYISPIVVRNNTVLKARAYKKGWIGSDVVQRTFYRSGITPDTIYLSETPHPKYPGKGAKTLVDHSLGETNISNGEWLAYKDYDMEFTIGFDNAQTLKSVEINALTAIGQHIFPVNSISVSGSNDRKQFIKIANADFKIAERDTPRQAELFGCSLPENTKFKYYRVTVSNLKEMPPWHQARGKPAWVFVDEVFLN